jgi:hypothetical protein
MVGTKPGQVANQLPAIQNVDKIIQELGGVTSALELRKDALQLAKQYRLRTQEEREIDFVWRLSALRRELNFFRPCYEAAEELCSGIHSVSQDMYLNYYLRPVADEEHATSQFAADWVGRADLEWLKRADELMWHLEKYGRAVQKAEASWIELWRHQSFRDKSRWI